MKLVVDVKQVGSVVSGRVLKMDESLRGLELLEAGGEIIEELCSIDSPELGEDCLCVRGENGALDSEPFAYTYDSVEDAQQVVEDINMLVAKVNQGCDNTMDSFEKELAVLINKHSIENRCDVPDFLLAEMIVNFIQAIGEPIKKTLDWHGCDSVCHPNPKEDELAEGE